MVDGGREYCSCAYYERTGKRCGHLWAYATYRLCGPVNIYEQDCAALAAAMSQSGRKRRLDHRDAGVITGVADVLEEEYLGYAQDSSAWDLQLGVADPMLTQVEPISSGPAPISPRESSPQRPQKRAKDLLVGRPARITPLHPTRKSRTRPNSSIAFGENQLPHPTPPTSAINTGTDCFALVVLHILVRHKEWLDLVKEVSSLSTAISEPKEALFALILQFAKAIQSKETQIYPNVKKILRGE